MESRTGPLRSRQASPDLPVRGGLPRRVRPRQRHFFSTQPLRTLLLSLAPPRRGGNKMTSSARRTAARGGLALFAVIVTSLFVWAEPVEAQLTFRDKSEVWGDAASITPVAMPTEASLAGPSGSGGACLGALGHASDTSSRPSR